MVFLMNITAFEIANGLQYTGEEGERTNEECSTQFYCGNFISKAFKEAMMRGIANKNSGVSALQSLPFVRDVSDAVTVAVWDALYFS